jgi:hypothetical protein
MLSYIPKTRKINWRHYQVLRVIVQPIVEKLIEMNRSTAKTLVERKWGKYQSDKGVCKKPEVSLSEPPPRRTGE